MQALAFEAEDAAAAHTAELPPRLLQPQPPRQWPQQPRLRPRPTRQQHQPPRPRPPRPRARTHQRHCCGSDVDALDGDELVFDGRRHWETACHGALHLENVLVADCMAAMASA